MLIELQIQIDTDIKKIWLFFRDSSEEEVSKEDIYNKSDDEDYDYQFEDREESDDDDNSMYITNSRHSKKSKDLATVDDFSEEILDDYSKEAVGEFEV